MGSERHQSGVTFLKAGEGYEDESVSPLETYDVENISDADDEDGAIEVKREDAERLALEKDGGEVRKLVDPLLPNKEEVDQHWVRGHFP